MNALLIGFLLLLPPPVADHPFGYGTSGNLLSITDAAGKVTAFTYAPRATAPRKR